MAIAITKRRKPAHKPDSRGDKAALLMHRSSTVSQWGNSLGVRIPQEAVDHLQLHAGEQIEVELREDSITIRPSARRKRWNLNALLAGVTPQKVGGEFPWGNAVGKEIF